MSMISYNNAYALRSRHAKELYERRASREQRGYIAPKEVREERLKKLEKTLTKFRV